MRRADALYITQEGKFAISDARSIKRAILHELLFEPLTVLELTNKIRKAYPEFRHTSEVVLAQQLAELIKTECVQWEVSQ